MNDTPARRIAPPPLLRDPGLRSVLTALPGARLVGGSVRDILAGRPVADIDLATPDPPDVVARKLDAAGIRSVPTGLDHGTLTAVIDGRGFEITTLRRDVDTDGRHAVVAFTNDWRADAARRDFTINAMSMTADGAVYDYFGGIGDLAAGLVRFVGDPAARIAEDYLRILRFFRFQARYGAQPIEAAAEQAIAHGVGGLSRLSVERIWSELKRILATPDPSESVAAMQRLGVLAAILPEGAAPARLAGLVATGAPPDPILRLAALLDGDADRVAARLRLSGAERERLLALRAAAALPAGATDTDIRRALVDTPSEVLAGRAWLAGGDAALLARLAATPPSVFPLHGRDLRACGVPAGPALGALLRDLRAWWMEGGCVADEAACRAELARRLAG